MTLTTDASKCEVIFSGNSIDMGLCDQIYHKIKIKKDAVQTYIRQHEL